MNNIEQALTDLKAGKLIVVADDPDREGEGDLLGVAEYATPETVNTMITLARGLVCVPMTEEWAERQGLDRMTDVNNDAFGTPFLVSADARTTSTGISAFDRADTIKQMADPKSTFADFYHPGHVFPLHAAVGGLKERDGHTEAGVALAELTSDSPVAYICEIIKPDGHMAKGQELVDFSDEHGFTMITIDDLIAYLNQQN
ncbi:GTP cyclohydrolase II [Lentilactobacillus senioris DSM 24302 = JCM 17472]|uniref:3,4-dihydroxy-2-butanone 4-phosphate synthase n=1 Tax=Lentilactobacillus senioris DSM 24302 = JCM 17472 TaxID=1423802 RepID=A0A0R2D1B5_9LACO|nr:3,4-dihydroxy-2-butanone-4-phosphate synthase [Lentilactobacillus senioris]KRM94203.1 GTP cyclohydrolase II [Lentilactobacillus senioris DSM 24302 = JCM 17472]